MSIFAHALRTVASSARRSYAAASVTNALADWRTASTSADAEIRGSFRKLVDRSRALERDNDYMRGYLGDCEDNIVGAIRNDLRCDAGEMINGKWVADRLAADKVEEAWRQWSRVGVCTVCGKHSWRDVKRLAARSTPRDGNFLMRKIRGRNAGNPFQFALQLLEVDHLALEKFEVLPGNRGEIRFGIEFNAFKRPVAYHLRLRHPGDSFGATAQRTERIPASEIYHFFVTERSNQSIGIPWAVSAITRLRQLGAFEEAAVIAARLGATQAGFFKKSANGTVGTWGGETDMDGNAVMDAVPGTFQELPEGWDIAPWNPKYPDINSGVFRKAMLMGVATGLRTSYITLGNDLEAVNYSSARVGIFDERETWKALQVYQDEHLHELVFADWLETSIMSGAINLPLGKLYKFNRPRFKARRWGYIDPVKEMAAAREGLALRLTSRRQLIDEAGGEIEDVFQDNIEDAKLANDMGLTLEEAKPGPMPPEDEETSTKPASG